MGCGMVAGGYASAVDASAVVPLLLGVLFVFAALIHQWWVRALPLALIPLLYAGLAEGVVGRGRRGRVAVRRSGRHRFRCGRGDARCCGWSPRQQTGAAGVEARPSPDREGLRAGWGRSGSEQGGVAGWWGPHLSTGGSTRPKRPSCGRRDHALASVRTGQGCSRSGSANRPALPAKRLPDASLPRYAPGYARDVHSRHPRRT